MKKLDEEVKKSDELLAQMIPKQVAEKVKAGINPMETCEVKKTLNLTIYNECRPNLLKVIIISLRLF